MYNTSWALNFNGFLNQQKMDLHQYVLFYDKYIANKNFIYTTTSPILPTFVVESKENQLPHLIGLQNWNNVHVKQASKQYELLKSGEWDIPYLQKADSGAYKEYRARIEFLPYLYKFLYNCDCSIKLIISTVQSSFKNRKIDMIFQKSGTKVVYVLELRDKKVPSQMNTFALTSVTIHKPNSSALKSKFTPLEIKSVKIVPN